MQFRLAYTDYHTGDAAIENTSSIEECKSKIKETVFLIAIYLPLATNGNQKHCFYRFLIRVCRLLITFSITRQSKTPKLSRNVVQKSIETVPISIAICLRTGDKWQSKTLFLTISDPRSSIVDNVFDYTE